MDEVKEANSEIKAEIIDNSTNLQEEQPENKTENVETVKALEEEKIENNFENEDNAEGAEAVIENQEDQPKKEEQPEQEEHSETNCVENDDKSSNNDNAENIANDSNNSAEKKDFQEEKKAINKPRKWWMIIIGAVLLLAILSTGFALLNINNSNIISGITIDKLQMQGLSKEDALGLLKTKIDEKINKELKIKAEDTQIEILLSQIELEYSPEKAVDEAYGIGRKSNIFVNNFNIIKSKIFGKNIDLEYKYNKELLDSIINDIQGKIPNAVQQVTYSVEDDELIITKGKKGLSIDVEQLTDEIEKNIKLNNFSDIYLNTFEAEPDDIDIEKIYEEVHTEPQDAYYTTNPFQIFAEVIGVDFDIEEAKEILKEDKDEYIIPLTITKPKKTVNDIGTEAFPDLLSSFSTRFDESNVPRSGNLRIAVGKLNGVVVMPGETFSYNKTLGKRTAEAGYRGAAGYEGGKVVEMLGGGICQISSTLYDAVVYANLEIIERHNHAFTTSYVGAGKDATVVYGSLDFKFKNTRKYPITLKASATNGIARIEIYGIKEETEYEIEIATVITGSIPFTVIYEDDYSLPAGSERVTQYGMNGCTSTTYKIYKLNGAEVKRETLSRDRYEAMNKYISRGPGGEAVEEEEEEEVTYTPPVPISKPEPTPEPDPEPTPDPTPDPDPGTSQEPNGGGTDPGDNSEP